LADVFDALTTKRCYKPAFSMDETLHIIKEGTGRHFDPKVIAAFDRSMDAIMAVKNKFSN
ncbi:MAG TPA: two-component system response regulator, partial [bacterium]|nr:two-component system response regulator [bacterium]